MPSHETAQALRILALVTDGFGSRGGIGQYNRDLLRAWAASPALGSALVLPRTGGDEAPPPHVTQLAARRSRWAYAASACRAAATEGPFDIVFCGHLHMAPLAAGLARSAGAHLWLQLHGIEAWERPSAVVRRAAERAALVTCVSRYTRQRFLRWARIEPEAVRVLPNTVEARFTPGPPDPALQARLGLGGKQVLLTVGRLSASERYKGHDVVLRAIAQMQDAMPELVYVIAGDGDDRPRLQALAASLGVASRVRFAGFFDDAQLPDLYRTADLFVMPSTGEGFGIVFLQALACGLGVVAGDADGSRDPLRDGADGTLVDARSPEAVAEAIRTGLAQGRRAPAPAAFGFVQYQAQVAALTASLYAGKA